VAEPPELFRLKCASHHYTADTNSTHFKQNNPLVCWVSTRCIHGSTGSKQVYLTRRRVYNHTSAHQLLIYRILNIITKCSDLSKFIQILFKQQAKQLVQVYSGRKLTRDYIHHGGEHHTQPEVWSHSGGSLPAASHSMVQPNGIEVGHAELSVGFSRVIPEKLTSKTKYTNTRQDLTTSWYI
jgi:hypothetical protein